MSGAEIDADRKLMTREERRAVLIAVEAYRSKTGVSEKALMRAVGVDADYLSRVRSPGQRLRWGNARKVFAFLEENPKGLPTCRFEPHGARLMAEIEQRREAQRAVEAERAARAAELDRRERSGVAAAVAPVALKEPSDLVRLVQVRYPALMARVIEIARDEGRMPGELILSLIEQGVAARGGA
jgi:hypothetical protein